MTKTKQLFVNEELQVGDIIELTEPSTTLKIISIIAKHTYEATSLTLLDKLKLKLIKIPLFAKLLKTNISYTNSLARFI